MRDELAKCRFDAAEYKELFLPRYRRNPVLFAKEVCGITPGGWQTEFLAALAEDMITPRGAHIALASGHETGKTFISCVAMFWGVNVVPDCHVYCTSATFEQLKTRLWAYLRRIALSSAVSGWFAIDSEKVVHRHIPGNMIKALAWSKDNPDSWAGEHCYSPWAVFDECSEIDSSIFESWSGSGVKRNAVTLLMGQPRVRHGKLFEAFHKEREYWRGIHLSSIDSPFASREFVEEARSKYGEESDYYRVRVLGMFPKADSSQLFPDAKMKHVEPADEEWGGTPPVVAGLDIAAGGADKTILVYRSGNRVVALEKFSTGEHVQLAKAIADSMIRKCCRCVAADSIGYGYGLTKLLQESKEIDVIPVNGSMKAINSRKYHNRRSEAYGRLSEAWKGLRFAAGRIRQSDLDDIGRQLEAIRINYDKDMRISVLPKLEIKEEIGESPDMADALAYSFMCESTGMLSPEERKARAEQIRNIQINSNPYR